MENLLQNIPYVIVRIDDILVSGAYDEDHLKNLEEVFKRLAKVGLLLKKGNCVFMEPQVTYLGHRVRKEGIQQMEDKVEAITNAPPPRNVSELKSYLGMINYYQKFLPNLSSVLAPLHRLLYSKIHWHLGKYQQQAFEQSKSFLKSSRLLVHYEDKKGTDPGMRCISKWLRCGPLTRRWRIVQNILSPLHTEPWQRRIIQI